MRIAAISNSRIPSATANSIQAMKVCDALVQAGHEVHLLIPAEAPATPWDVLSRQYGIRHPFRIQRLASRRILRRVDFVWQAHANARKLGANLVYTWLPQSAAVEVWRGAPVVLEMHADVAGIFGPWWLRQFWGRGGKRRLLATTQALRRALERSTGIAFPDASVQIAPNGVDLERFEDLPGPSEARRRLGLTEQVTMGFTGHFYPGRGIDLLFDLAGILPSMQFLWVGGTADAVKHWRGELSAAKRTNVIMTGFVDNSRLPLYQAAADILMMPYGNRVAASSGQDIAEVINPMKMFEYMAAGRAIITADLPVIREILDDASAVFCPPGDLDAWRSAIVELAGDADRRSSMARSARGAVLRYTWLERARSAVAGLNRE